MTSLWIEIHDFCVIWMTSLIWLVQVLIYPTFLEIEESLFRAFHKRHCDRIALFVTPMILQALMAALILLDHQASFEWTFHASGIFVIFGVTALYSAPSHTRLSKGKDLKTIKTLIRFNWFRTLIWSAELILILIRKFQSPSFHH